MLAYLVRRFATALLSIFLAAVLVFCALLAIPGDPAEIILGINAQPQARLALRERLGLNDPPVLRFTKWFSAALRGDLGESLNYRRPVAGLIADRLKVSIPLAVASALLACLIALPLGVLAALKRGTLLDPLIVMLSQIGAAIPSFWLGLMLILLFSVSLGWLPAAGFTPWERSPQGYLRSLALPVLALALGQAAVMTRLSRAAMLEVLTQDYVRTARSKGLTVAKVVWKHALRNALVTIITIVGLSLATILIGSIVIEQVFAIPGLGQLALKAIKDRDYPLLQGQVLVYASLIVMINFLVDMSYSFLDPRIRYD